MHRYFYPFEGSFSERPPYFIWYFGLILQKQLGGNKKKFILQVSVYNIKCEYRKL